MSDCDLETSVPDWVIDHPETLGVFQELGIDCSCGGKSLGYACRERGLDGERVLARLRECVGRGEAATEGSWLRDHLPRSRSLPWQLPSFLSTHGFAEFIT